MQAAVVETEVTEKARRRRFSAKYKLRVLALADACSKPGEVGELLRKEGLYSSHLTSWRKARAEGELAGLAEKRRGPAPKIVDERDRRIAELERDLKRSQARTQRVEALLEIQKKVSELLGIQLTSPDEES